MNMDIGMDFESWKTMADYPDLFADKCTIDVYTPLYADRLEKAAMMGCDMYTYMQICGVDA